MNNEEFTIKISKRRIRQFFAVGYLISNLILAAVYNDKGGALAGFVLGMFATTIVLFSFSEEPKPHE